MKKIFSLLLLLTCLNAGAAVWHISPTGNDASGLGTIAAPWRTLNKACTMVTAPGDFIHVYAGTYLETSQCLLNPAVNIEGDDSANTIIQGTMTAQFTAILVLQSAEGTNGNQTITKIKFDGRTQATSLAIMVLGRSNVDISYCSFMDFQDGAAWFAGQNSFFPNNVPPSVYADGNSFHHNYSWNCAGFITASAYGTAHVWAHGTVNFQFHHNRMIQTNRTDGNNGWLLKLLDYTRGTKIYNDTLQAALFPAGLSFDGQGGYHGFAIEAADQDGLEMYNCDIQGSVDFNRQVKGIYPYSVWVHNNKIYRPSTPAGVEFGLYFEFSSDGLIVEDNVLQNMQHGIFFSLRNGDSVTNSVIRRNEIRNLGGPVNGGGQGEGIQFNCDPGNTYTVRNVDIDNNSITGNPSYTIQWGISISNTSGIYNMRVRNNAIKNFQGAYIVSGSAGNIFGLTLQNNASNNNGSGNAPLWLNGTPTVTSSGNITSNPLFISDASNLRLQAGSPCIDAGIDVGSGNDIGAYQYSAGGNISPTANAGANQTLPAGSSTATLTGNGSDADGTIAGYSWVKLSGPACTITSPANATTGITGLTAGIYLFELTVTDNGGATGTDQVQITVTAAGAVDIRYHRPIKLNL